ncbi:MAG: Imm49 family immunity protein [Candidatus Desantisbacteria bacterium]
MRKYPHKPDLEWIKQGYERHIITYKEDISEESEFLKQQYVGFFRGQMWEARDFAACSHAFEEPIENVLMYLREACRNLSIAIEFGLVMDDAEFFIYLSLALIVRDNELVKQLSGFDRQRYTNPEVGSHEAEYLLAEIYADLAGDRHASATERVPKAISELSSRSLNRIQKRYLQSKVMMAKAIIDRNQEEFDKAIESRHKDFTQFWSRSDMREFYKGLLDIDGLGLIRIAMDNGLVCNVQSVYLPLELLAKD